MFGVFRESKDTPVSEFEEVWEACREAYALQDAADLRGQHDVKYRVREIAE